MNPSIQTATHHQLPDIIELLELFNLDAEELDAEEFVLAHLDGEIIGLGRVRDNEDALELCSIGVVETHRNKGIGSAIIQSLMTLYPEQSLYIVTEIPVFFKRFNFNETETYPESIADKITRCKDSYNCATPVAMHIG